MPGSAREAAGHRCAQGISNVCSREELRRMLQKPRQALNGNVHRREEDDERVDYLSNEPCGLPVSAEEAHERPQAGE